MNPRSIYLIKRAEIEVTSRMNKAFEIFAITPIQYTVLYFVESTNGDLSSAQLSRRFSMTPQSMNELITVLEKKKLIKKTTDPAHRRILRISLTHKGKKVLEDCNKLMDEMEESMFTEFTKVETELLRSLLRKFLDAARETAKA